MDAAKQSVIPLYVILSERNYVIRVSFRTNRKYSCVCICMCMRVYLFARVCDVRAYVRVRVRECVCACVYVCVFVLCIYECARMYL